MKLFVIILIISVIINCVQCGVRRKSKSKQNNNNHIDPSDDNEVNQEHVDKINVDWNNLGNDEHRQCGYKGCPKIKPNMLNVHLVPHTHDDVGWLKTVDQYYYGSKTLIQKASVQYILDSVIQALLSDPEKRFIYVESAFFFMWWRKQTPELQEQVKMLVNEGRLEFVGGAWSMNDEAATHYQSIIDQFTLGLRMLNDTFGECGRPRVGWQIDPFGHSREQASLFARMGYDGMFFGRLDYEDKKSRLLNQNAEMIWKASASLGSAADLFTGVLYNNYGPPPGFCFDILCQDDPIIDEKWSPDNNVKEKVDKFFDYVTNMSAQYRSNNVLITMGEDFNYQNANVWYKNLDKLIKYANDRQKDGSQINLFYSTPSCYLKSLHESNLTWPTKSDDFFPYASDPHSFWTGYFTSRPTLKHFERVGNKFLQICKQLTAVAPESEDHFEPHLQFLQEQMGVMQHHDAVTGTEKQHVAADYARRLQVAIDACTTNIKSVLNQFTTGQLPSNLGQPANPNYHNMEKPYHRNYTFTFSNCLELNISKCEVSEKSGNFMVTVYNPLAYSTFAYIRVPVPAMNYDVTDYRGVATPIQFVEVPDAVKQLSYRFSSSAYDLIFLANELPPMGYKSYYIAKNIGKNREEKAITIGLPGILVKVPTVIQLQSDSPPLGRQPAADENVIIGNKYLNVTFNQNGLVSRIFTDGENITLSQNFYYYEGAYGDNREFKNRSSGAYIFRPNSTALKIAASAKLYVTRGQLVDEVHQQFNEWLSQVIRVYKDENLVEFEWMVGPIPVDDYKGREIVTRFSSEINSNGIFYTDSNGRETIKRVRNYRPTWNVKLMEETAGNYYPVTTKIALEDDKLRMAVLTDRAQGGTSMNDGELELMVHRRLLHDDAFGVAEALNEMAFGKGLVARGSHYLIVGSKSKQNPSVVAREKVVQAEKMDAAWPFFSDVSSMDYGDWRQQYTNIKSAVTLSLPVNVHLVSFEPWNDREYLVRFEHLFEEGEDSTLSNPVKINVHEVFRDIPFNAIRETNLAANQWLSDVQRLQFQEEKSSPAENLLDSNVQRVVISSSTQQPQPVVPTVSIESVYVNDRGSPKHKHPRSKKIRDSQEFEITLKPMEIRTFILYTEE